MIVSGGVSGDECLQVDNVAISSTGKGGKATSMLYDGGGVRGSDGGV